VVGDGSFHISSSPRASGFVEPPGEAERGDPFDDLVAALSTGFSSIVVFKEAGAITAGFTDTSFPMAGAGFDVEEDVVVIKTCSGSGFVGSMWKVYCLTKGS